MEGPRGIRISIYVVENLADGISLDENLQKELKREDPSRRFAMASEGSKKIAHDKAPYSPGPIAPFGRASGEEHRFA